MKKNILFGVAFMALTSMSAQNVEVATGDYNPDWESLKQWECPEWFKDAKFGIWAHWGPQCQAEAGDWYARHMYFEGEWQSDHHIEHFGWMGDFGLKDLCNAWKAEEWDPDALVKFYKSVGARYFFTLGNHHDNFDLWDSPYQEWNSMNVGPKKDIIRGWADACDKYGLPLGISMHASHTWTWLEIAQDYDGNLTKEDGYELNPDGTEKWWKGLDPQELYAQRHTPSAGYDNVGTIHSQWAWGNGASLPSEEYKMKFQNRVLECINTFSPDMLYFDDTVLPFYGCDESIGLNILSHYYNTSAKQNGGEQQVVSMGKILENQHKELMLWDVERGIPDRPQEKYWQTCTCLGTWHYDKGTYERGDYKSAQQVVSMLVDIVSKNGNMLLSVPVRGNGTIDEKEVAILNDIKAWMDVNSVSIYGTRPWKTFGEGPLAEASNPLNSQGFNEGNNYSSADVRFVERNDTVFATTLRYPTSRKYTMKTFGLASKYYSGAVKSVTLLGHGKVDFVLDIDGLVITMPETPANKLAAVFAIEFDENSSATVSLEEIISIYEEKVKEMRLQSNYNTGKFSREKVNAFAELVEQHKQNIGADDVTQQLSIKALHTAYNELRSNGINEGSAPNENGAWDYTTEYLIEANNFTRKEETGTRFAAPLNWTVENFRIPNGGDGVKNGLDNYEGNDALMLGVWNDRDANEEGDLSNARIYRTVHLEAGRYYFGGAYNALYQLSDQAYIFAADATSDTYDLEGKSIAFVRLNKGKTNGEFYGIYFTIEEDMDVTLGFQVNLFEGSATQEVRVDDVKLLYYGAMDYMTLENLILEIDAVLSETQINDNTGFYSKSAAEELQQAWEEAEKVKDGASYEEISNAYNSLNAAYENFKTNGKNAGGAPMAAESTDLTVDVLSEVDNFSRSENGTIGVRYGTPQYWTVENYNIPAGGQGNRNGIDSYPGYDCLSLGIWNDMNQNTDGSISDARIYQTVTLEPGRYYFGATYQTTYSISSDAYIFVAPQTMATSEIPTQSIAYYPISMVPDKNDGSWHGLFFTLEEETEVVLGFQADLTKGSSTQEFRAKGVKLLYYGEITFSKLEQLISDLESNLKSYKINDNTGHYSQKAYETLVEAINAAKTIGADSPLSEVSNAYNALNLAFDDFIQNGKNKSGAPEEIGSTNITEEYLIEAENFSRLDASVNTRFTYPLNWTSENFGIESFTEGTRGGLDKWPGFDCLGIGVWDDKANNVLGSDLTNTRLYRKVTLDAGRYFFGAAYDAVYNMNLGYVYVANTTLNTADIEQRSIAYHKIAEAPISNDIHGLYFTLDESQEVVIAFQVDIENGPATQEFRAKKLALLSYNASTGIESVEKDGADATPDFTAPATYFSITGQQLNSVPAHGLFIMRQNGATFKLYKK